MNEFEQVGDVGMRRSPCRGRAGAGCVSVEVNKFVQVWVVVTSPFP